MRSAPQCLLLLLFSKAAVQNPCTAFSLHHARHHVPLWTAAPLRFRLARTRSRRSTSALLQRECRDLPLKASEKSSFPLSNEAAVLVSRETAAKSASLSRRMLRTCTHFLHRILLLPVDLLGRFLGAVLARAISHPPLRQALGACIVSGVQQLCEDPNLDEYIDRATTTINEDLEDDARELAMAVPKMVRGFFQGLSDSASSTTTLSPTATKNATASD